MTVEMMRLTGIEPVFYAWEAYVLPLNERRVLNMTFKNTNFLIKTNLLHLIYAKVQIQLDNCVIFK